MPSALTIPGVQVRTDFEPAPVLPGATGIIGVVGVVDRGPLLPTPIGNFAEFIDQFGPASRYSLPEVRTAFANGVQQMVVARIEPGRGQKARLDLFDDEGERVARLEARAEGAWANRLAVRATQTHTLSETTPGIKYVTLEVSLDGQSIETHANLNLDAASPDYFFDRINTQSRVLVAVDPLFEKALPASLARTPLAAAEPRAAFAVLRAGADDVLRATARQNGADGNRLALRVDDGQAGLALSGAANAASVDVRARRRGLAGTTIRISVQAAADGAVNLIVLAPPAAARSYGPFASPAEIVAGLAADPDVEAEVRGAAQPSILPSTALARRIDLEVLAEGQDSARYAGLATLEAIAALNDPLVRFETVAAATALPAVQGVPLDGGRGRAPVLALPGDNPAQPALLELVLAPGAAGEVAVALTRGVSTIDNATGVISVEIFQDDALNETLSNLTMDPDDVNYLPAVLRSSALLRAHDLFVRSRATSFPRHMLRAEKLSGGASPSVDDYQDALDRLEQAEEVDLVIASAAQQLSEADIIRVHQRVAAHCAKMADVARNRIGLGSVAAVANAVPARIIDHANAVRSDHFALTAPAGSEAAFAGVLGLQDYFQSPTFKNVLALDVAPGRYSDAQLTQLVRENVLVINERRRIGIVVVKGILTSGRQVNVQRTVNKSVRDVKAIADKYVGLLNNEGVRNALKQQIFALLLQMERDGALVPSTDGKDPAFGVDVYSTQADFANGIVRIDIKLRPVRAIDYIYATIFVKN